MNRPPQDPASLDNLRDIVLPPEPPWWPPAPGWFVLGAALLLAGALLYSLTYHGLAALLSHLRRGRTETARG